MAIGEISGYSYNPYYNNASGTYNSSRSANTAALGDDVANIKGIGSNRKVSPEECQTCKERKYQDGSDENVSFKSASHISPSSSASKVMAHEAEHVSNAYTKAAEKNGEVVSAGVTISTAVCPECGRTYTSGGETRTVIKYPNESNPYQQNQKSLDALGFTGANVDLVA